MSATPNPAKAFRPEDENPCQPGLAVAHEASRSSSGAKPAPSPAPRRAPANWRGCSYRVGLHELRGARRIDARRGPKNEGQNQGQNL